MTSNHCPLGGGFFVKKLTQTPPFLQNLLLPLAVYKNRFLNHLGQIFLLEKK
jgi:hypothetical protein